MTATALDMTVLEDLDVPIPCTLRLTAVEDCPGMSTWILYLRHHDCGKRPMVTHTICTRHYEKLTSGVLVGRCTVCQKWAKMLDYVLRLEPLNSKGNRQ